MRKVVKLKGAAKRKRGRAKANTVKTVDLAKLEQPTDRADVFFDDDAFEKQLEEVQLEEATFEVRVPFAAIRARMRAGPLSPVPLAISGCVCLLVLHVTHTPEWAQLGGMLLPWTIALSWVVCRALERRRDAPWPPHEPEPSAPGPNDMSAGTRSHRGLGPGSQQTVVRRTSAAPGLSPPTPGCGPIHHWR